MKYLVILMLAAGIMFGQSVVNAITAPVNASGLAWDGAFLWCGAYGVNGDTIYKLDPADGTILKRLRWRSGADVYGLAFDTGNLWVSDHLSGTDSLFRVDTITGARIAAIPAHKEYMAGLANDGTDLWHCVYYNPDGRAYRIQKSDGTVLDSINIPSLPQPWGATWDGTHLWVCNDGNYGGGHRIYQINVGTQQIVDSLDSPGTRPWGLAWDGTYLWVIARGSSPTGFVAYQIDLEGGGTPDIQVNPASYDYGYVATDSIASFALTVTNAGDGTLTIDSAFAANPVFYLATLSFPFDIAAGGDTSFNVYFDPDTNIGYASQLLIISNDPVNETTYVALSGRGVYPEATLDPEATSHDFGGIRVNCVKDWGLTIVNQGFPALTIDSIVFNDVHFFTGNLQFPVIVSCLDTTCLQIIARPDAAGGLAGDAWLFSNDPTGPIPIQLSANGDTALPQAGDLLWSYDFPDNVVCVAGIADINGDDLPDVAAEVYNAGTSIVQHLNTFWSNSSGHGVRQWGFGDAATTGSWGDDCLIQGSDYNGDSIPDILLGTGWGDRSVYAIDAITGAVLWFYDSHSFDGEGGWVYTVRPMPDVNGDDVGEVLAGIGGNTSPGGGPRSMYCFSGADGQIIWRFQALDAIGSVNWIEDMNNDNVPEAICGAWGNNYDQRVYCVSGASSGVVYTPIWAYDCGGDAQSVIAIPDVSGDGKQDVVAGAWSDSVFCLNGASGARIWARHVGGEVLKVAQVPDLVAPGVPGIAAAHFGSTFQLLNANDGSVRWTYAIGSNTWSVDAIEDLDGDGKGDVVAGNQTPGIVYCFSGDNGDVIWSHNEGRLIYSLRAVTDISFDGHQDVLVGTQASGIARFLALCGGTPDQATAEDDDSPAFAISIYPRISCTGFAIRFDQGTVDDIAIYDAAGRRVMTYTNLRDLQHVTWNGCDDRGRPVAQGVYFVDVQGRAGDRTEKIVVTR